MDEHTNAKRERKREHERAPTLLLGANDASSNEKSRSHLDTPVSVCVDVCESV